jgi:ribulose-5-phosphate 4-epimerase/fuculose-1-phosphate aldolase
MHYSDVHQILSIF